MKSGLSRNDPLDVKRANKIAIHLIMIIVSIACLVPLLMVISISLSDGKDIFISGFRLIPLHFTTQAYDMIFHNPGKLVSAYKVTILVTVIGTFSSLFMTSMFAYALSRRDFKLRKVFSFYIFFTMLFGGGLVPWYILITKYLALKNTLAVLIVPYLISPWYVFLMRTFLQSIHISMIESAKLDGASEFRVYRQIILPLSTPALATIGLLTSLGYWNDWWLSMLFVDSYKLYPLQLFLKIIMDNVDLLRSYMNNVMSGTLLTNTDFPSEGMRMAMCMLTIGPILLVFPFLQKYFVKGLTVGSIKG